MEELINNGVIVINKDKSKSFKKTIVILGVARSGTSMVAKVLEQLGVFMGQNRDQAVFEDVQIARILEGNFKKQELLDLIEERNSKYDIWGFKRPGALNYITKYSSYFRNIHFIIPFRDILAIAQRNKLSMKMDFMKSLRRANSQYLNVIDLVATSQNPYLLFSYEKSLTKKKEFVYSLIEFLEIDPSEDLIEKAISSIEVDCHNYLLSSRVKGDDGNFKVGGNQTIFGWVKDKLYLSYARIKLIFNY
jgi:hypothetical protein